MQYDTYFVSVIHLWYSKTSCFMFELIISSYYTDYLFNDKTTCFTSYILLSFIVKAEPLVSFLCVYPI